jgi:hypothetical protein
MTRAWEVDAEYRFAFDEFSRKAQRVQSLAAQQISDGNAFESALLELEQAHLAYNQARDAFLRCLLPASEQLTTFSDQERASDVTTLAELLWERAGRPDGTAEEDWRRAEAIVKTAVATAGCH